MEAQLVAHNARMDEKRKEWENAAASKCKSKDTGAQNQSKHHVKSNFVSKVQAIRFVDTVSGNANRDLPLFARVSQLESVQVWDEGKVINRSWGGMLALDCQVARNAADKLRRIPGGHVGDRFKDHGSGQVLQEVIDESSHLLADIAAHEATRRKRMGESERWIGPSQESGLDTRQSGLDTVWTTSVQKAACTSLVLGKWSEPYTIPQGGSLHFKMTLAMLTDPALPPTINVLARGMSDDDDPDLMMSRLEIPTRSNYQWRSMSAGADKIEILPNDPSYSCNATYFITVSCCTAACAFRIRSWLSDDKPRQIMRLTESIEAEQAVYHRSIKHFLHSSSKLLRHTASGAKMNTAKEPPQAEDGGARTRHANEEDMRGDTDAGRMLLAQSLRASDKVGSETRERRNHSRHNAINFSRATAGRKDARGDGQHSILSPHYLHSADTRPNPSSPEHMGFLEVGCPPPAAAAARACASCIFSASHLAATHSSLTQPAHGMSAESAQAATSLLSPSPAAARDKTCSLSHSLNPSHLHPYSSVAASVMAKHGTSARAQPHPRPSTSPSVLREMAAAFKEARRLIEEAPPSYKLVWIIKDPSRSPRSNKDLMRIAVPDLPPRKTSKVLALASAPPPIPPRCDYEAYLEKRAAKEDVSRRLIHKLGKLKSVQLKKALEKAARTLRELPEDEAPDYRGMAAAAIQGLALARTLHRGESESQAHHPPWCASPALF